jgi:uncharacterized protein
LCPKPQKGFDLPTCFFATDLHGNTDRYDKLLASIIRHVPAAVFLGGDLLPHSALSAMQFGQGGFVHDYLVPAFTRTRDTLGVHYPDVFVILGNDEPRRCEEDFVAAAADGLWQYVHEKKVSWGISPSMALATSRQPHFCSRTGNVSRYVPPGCVSPEEGSRTVPTEESEIKWSTIQKDLASLVGEDPLERAVLLLHTPPCDTPLDRAALDGKTYEHVPLDVHVGSIALKRFIEERQPLLTLHGHVHESARLSGEWKIRIGRTVSINGAHDGPELALVRFDLESPEAATRDLI